MSRELERRKKRERLRIEAEERRPDPVVTRSRSRCEVVPSGTGTAKKQARASMARGKPSTPPLRGTQAQQNATAAAAKALHSPECAPQSGDSAAVTAEEDVAGAFSKAWALLSTLPQRERDLFVATHAGFSLFELDMQQTGNISGVSSLTPRPPARSAAGISATPTRVPATPTGEDGPWGATSHAARGAAQRSGVDPNCEATAPARPKAPSASTPVTPRGAANTPALKSPRRPAAEDAPSATKSVTSRGFAPSWTVPAPLPFSAPCAPMQPACRQPPATERTERSDGVVKTSMKMKARRHTGERPIQDSRRPQCVDTSWGPESTRSDNNDDVVAASKRKERSCMSPGGLSDGGRNKRAKKSAAAVREKAVKEGEGSGGRSERATRSEKITARSAGKIRKKERQRSFRKDSAAATDDNADRVDCAAPSKDKSHVRQKKMRANKPTSSDAHDRVHESLDTTVRSVGGVPPVQVNELGDPCGVYWKRMKDYAFEWAASQFLWHIDWNKQCPILKARFLKGIRKEFPGE